MELPLSVSVLGLDDGNLEFGTVGRGDNDTLVVGEDHRFFEGSDATSSGVGFAPFAIDHSFEDPDKEAFHSSFVPSAFFCFHCFVSHIVLWQPGALR